MQNFRDLVVWQKAHAFTLRIYQSTRSFPREELYGVVSQLRRAAASIPTNIAEGCGRPSQVEFGRFLGIAFSSACESEYLLLLSLDLGYLESSTHQALFGDVCEAKRMLQGLLKKLKADS